MKTFPKEQMEALKAQAAGILEQLDEGRSTRDVMAQIYADNLSGMTVEQGQLVADTILKTVKEFDVGYLEAQQDLDQFVGGVLDKLDSGKSCVERCNYWLKLSTGIASATAAMNGESVDRNTILAQIENLSVPEEEATPARERELRELTEQALKNSGVMLSALGKQAQALQELNDAGEATAMLLDLGSREIEYRAVEAMLAYTKIKNGEFKNVPADTGAEQLTVMVCAENEQTRIAADVANGNLAVDVATVLLTTLGTVVLALCFVPSGVIGVAAATFVFNSILLTIPFCLVVAAGLALVLGLCIRAWYKTSRKLAKPVVHGVKTVIDGLLSVAAYIRDHVIPAVVQTAKTLLGKLRKASPAVRETNGIPAQ